MIKTYSRSNAPFSCHQNCFLRYLPSSVIHPFIYDSSLIHLWSFWDQFIHPSICDPSTNQWSISGHLWSIHLSFIPDPFMIDPTVGNFVTVYQCWPQQCSGGKKLLRNLHISVYSVPWRSGCWIWPSPISFALSHQLGSCCSTGR